MSSSIHSIEGLKILITGATGGIGKSIVRLLHKQGAILGISGTKESILDDIKDELKNNIHILPCNLFDNKSAENLPKQASDLMNGLHGVVCNAGITRDTLSLRMKDKDWDDVLQINLNSVFKINKAACKILAKNKSGSIVNISSIIGFIGGIGQANYSATKAGIIGMSKSLALEFASKSVRINCIAPGFIETPMSDSIPAELSSKIIERIPLKRQGSPDEIAAVVRFLLGKESSYITGETIHANGGLLMH